MPRGQYARSTRSDKKTSSHALAVMNGGIKEAMLIPKEQLTSWNDWEKLNEDEQERVEGLTQKLAGSMLREGIAKIQSGEYLTTLRDILEPYNMFGRYLRRFRFSKRTAYRRITAYANAKNRLPEPVLNIAIARGFNLAGDTDEKPLGNYTKAAAALPPPQTSDPVQINTWLDQLENVRKEQSKREGAQAQEAEIVPVDPQDALRDTYRNLSRLIKRLPANGKTKQAFLSKLTGMLMSEMGIAHAMSFHPIPIPEDFRNVARGRPKAAGAASAA